MIVFPAAKINLGLNVIAKRDDGFHSIESVMLRIPLCDILEVVVDPALADGTLEIEYSGIAIPQSGSMDLCQQAHSEILGKRTLPGLRVHLHKNIPIGAGLGGGSSDCASMLSLVNSFTEQPLDPAQLDSAAASLGSDVPFFLRNSPQAVSGRGELLCNADVDLNGKFGVIVDPGIHISTAAAYGGTPQSGLSVDIEKLLAQPVSTWQGQIFNSMEVHAFKSHPVLADIKRSLYAAGAEFALMSGSGSTLFGIFDKKPATLEWPEGYSCWSFSF